MAIKDSDIFKCYVHDFGTVEPEQWRQHQAEQVHTHNGTTSCKDCGVPNIEFSYTGKLVGVVPPAYCKECKERLRKELAI